MAHYSIKDLEYLSGVKAHTIRIWEKRFNLLNPERSETNIRYYSDEDVRKLLNVSMLVKNGYKISFIATFDDARIQREILRQRRGLPDLNRNIDRLLIHTINLDTFGFEQVLKEIISENGFLKTIQTIVFPFFERIGLLWQTGSIFIAHEHFVSNLIRNWLIVESSKFNNQESTKRILFFLPEAEMHELGLLYFNYLAAENGFKCIYLGQNLPFNDLSNLLRNTPFDFICTSFINAIEKQELEQYLANLSLVFKQNKILISGRQLAIHKPKLPRNVYEIKTHKDFIRKISM